MPESNLVTQLTFKQTYRLTDTTIALMGPPDTTAPNPYYKGAGAPMKLYDRGRVEQWIKDHPHTIARSRMGQKSARQAVDTKREKARSLAATLCADLHMDTETPLDQIKVAARAHFLVQYDNFTGKLTDRGLCGYIRHNHTNYEDILHQVKGRVGALDLYHAVKVYLCAKIITQYGLSVPPLLAAFRPGDVPDAWLSVSNPERHARGVLGLPWTVPPSGATS